MSKVPKWITDAFNAAWIDIRTMESDEPPEALARELLARIPVDRFEAIIEAKVIGRLYEVPAVSTSKAVALAAKDASRAIVALLSDEDGGFNADQVFTVVDAKPDNGDGLVLQSAVVYRSRDAADAACKAENDYLEYTCYRVHELAVRS